MKHLTNRTETTVVFNRQDIGTVWHTTEKGKDIVSMHDAQYRALVEYIATLESHNKLLREECRKARAILLADGKEAFDTIAEDRFMYRDARAATDAAGAMG